MPLQDDMAAFYANYERTPGAHRDQFGAQLVTQRTPIVELNSSYGLSALRNVTTLAGTGAVAADATTGEIKVSTGATTSSSAILESTSRGRYVPGYGAEVGVGIRIPTLPTGDQRAIWGGLGQDQSNGFYFGVDATDFFIGYLRDDVETKVYRDDWNIDTLLRVDLTRGVIFQVKFTWYGYGQIIWGVVITDANKNQKFTPVHSFTPDGATSVLSPNLEVHVETTNGSTASNFEIFVGGRSYSIIGAYEPKYRHVGEFRGSVATSTTPVPLISFRFKAGFKDRNVKFDEATVIPATEAVRWDVRLDPTTLTGASWGTPSDHTAAETAMEADKAATAVAGGIIIYDGIAPAGAANKFSTAIAALSDLDIPEDSVITLCARSITGTGTILSHLNLIEEW